MTNAATFLTQLFLLFCLTITPYLAQAEGNKSDTQPAISSAEKVNINTANAELLANSLKGVGLKKAQAIVKYRDDFGAFQHIQELEAVKGIGPSILAKNAELISIN